MKLNFIFSLLFVSSCFSSSNVKVDVIAIHFGSGGGVTGEYTNFYLNNEGSLYKNDKLVKTLEGKIVLGIFAKANGIKAVKYSKSGNMSNYLKIELASGKSNRITWASQNTDVNKKVLSLYKELKSYSK